MKMKQMKKRVLASLWAVALLTISAVTAYADVAVAPEPEPVRSGATLLTVLIISAVVLAVAVIAWVLSHRGHK